MPLDIFRLSGQIEIDTSRAENSLRRVDGSVKRTHRELGESGNAGRRAGSQIAAGMDRGAAGVNQASRAVSGLSGKLSSLRVPSLNLSSAGKGMLGDLGAVAGGNLLSGVISSAFSGVTGVMKSGFDQGIQYNSMLEKANISFTNLLGSSGAATKHLKDLQAFGEATPFEFPDLIQASQRMQAMGFEGKNIIPTLRNVGDAVSAVGGGKDELMGIVNALGQMRNGARIQSEELEQLVERGVDGYGLLGKAIGKSKEETIALVRAGKVKSGAVDGIVAMMGERSGGLMEKMSQTYEGRMSNLNDIAARRLGEATQPAFERLSLGYLKATEGLATAGAQAFVNEMRALLDEQFKTAQPMFDKLATGEAFKPAVSAVKAVGSLDNAAKAFNAGQYSVAAQEVGNAITEGLSTGILQPRDSVDEAFKQLVVGGIGYAKKLLGIESPSKVFAEIGGNVVLGFVGGIDQNINLSSAGIKKWAKQIEKNGGAEFLKAVEAMAARLKIDPNKILNVMAFESGLNPAKKNPNGSASGLIQFTDKTAEALGTTTAKLRGMNAIEQLVYVEKYFAQFRKVADTQEAVYTAVLAGRPVSNPESVLFRDKGKKSLRDPYYANRALDKDGSGTVTAREAAAQTYKQGFLNSTGTMNALTVQTARVTSGFSALAAQLPSLTSGIDKIRANIFPQRPSIAAIPKPRGGDGATAKPFAGSIVQGGEIFIEIKSAVSDLLPTMGALPAELNKLSTETTLAKLALPSATAAMVANGSRAGEWANQIDEATGKMGEAIDHLSHFKDTLSAGFDDMFDAALSGQKISFKDFGKQLFKGLTSSLISSATGGQAQSPGQLLAGLLTGGLRGGGASASGGGAGAVGSAVSAMANVGSSGSAGVGAGVGIGAAINRAVTVSQSGGGKGGGNPVSAALDMVQPGGLLGKGGLLSKIPGIGKAGGFLKGLPGIGGALGKLGGFLGLGGGGAAAGAGAAGAGGAAGATGMAAMFSNPVTAVIAGGLIAAPFIAKLFGKDPLADYKKHVKSEFGIDASKQMLTKIMQIGQSKFGAEWEKRKIETVRLDEVRNMLAEYSGAFQKRGNARLFDSRIFGDAFASVNQFKVPMLASGGPIVGAGTGTSDSVPLWGSNGEYVIKAAAVSRYGKGMFDALNNMALPVVSRADGGMIGASTAGQYQQERSAELARMAARSGFFGSSFRGVASQLQERGGAGGSAAYHDEMKETVNDLRETVEYLASRIRGISKGQVIEMGLEERPDAAAKAVHRSFTNRSEDSKKIRELVQTR